MSKSPIKPLFDDYVYMRREIKRLMAENTTISDVVRGSSAEAPYTQHTIRISGVDRQYATWIAERVESLTDMCARVEKAVSSAPNSLIRLILTYRYLDGIENWKQVGEMLPVPRSGDACRKLAHRYIDGLSE